jgi:tetratricopeptide (TPR) repeat protein
MHNMALLLGNDHPSLAPHYWGFGQALGERNRRAEAIPLMVDALRISRKANVSGWDPAPSLAALERQVRWIAVRAGLSAESYQAAFNGAAALLADQPDTAAYRELRGMAAYRLGRCDEALTDLGADSETRDSATDRARQRAAFLAMAELRLGNVDSARRRVTELQDHLEEGATPAKETLNLVEEAEALLSAECNED